MAGNQRKDLVKTMSLDEHGSGDLRPRSSTWSNIVKERLQRVRRQRTVSETTDASSGVDSPAAISAANSALTISAAGQVRSRQASGVPHSPAPALSDVKESHQERNLSFGNSEHMVYDIDGKFPYSYYESKPTFYDIDGKHRYKYYQPLKPTPYTSGAPHHENRPWIYDLTEGKVMCLTSRDVQGNSKMQ